MTTLRTISLAAAFLTTATPAFAEANALDGAEARLLDALSHPA